MLANDFSQETPLPVRVKFLRQVYLFKTLAEEELTEIASRLSERSLAAGETLFSENDEGDYFYIIRSGKVRLTHQVDEEDEVLARMEIYEAFGEEALLYDQPRSATVTAITATQLYALNIEDFGWLLENYPQIQHSLSIFARSYQIARSHHFEWVSEDEVIKFIDRRHPIRMWMEWLGVTFIMSVLLTLLGGIAFVLQEVFDQSIIANYIWCLASIAGVIGIFLWLWTYLEWRNDYFIVTDQRVIWRERLLLRGTSRQEAPLRTIQSVNVQTQNWFNRLLNMGDVTVRTFNSMLRMKEVRNPDKMASIINEFLLHARRRSRILELDTIRHTIRQRLGYSQEGEEAPQGTRALPIVEQRRLGLGIFWTRTIEGDMITYHKHWTVFLKKAWLPSLFLIGALPMNLALMALAIDGSIDWLAALITLSLTLLVIVPWWGYHYIDWRNDLYQVTRDMIFDKEKKPFAEESTRSAPIKNIQSLGHEIPSLIGRILNVGMVHINVGDQTLDFVGVHDPALIHQDISRKMEEFVAAEERARATEEYERMSTWLEIYHKETEEYKNRQNRPKYW